MKNETVEDFALALRIPVQLVLDQFSRAGLRHQSRDSIVTSSDKTALLMWLRNSTRAVTKQSHAPKKISKEIYCLIDAGYITKSFFRVLKYHQHITEPNSIKVLAGISVNTAFSDQDTRSAQALIELLPQNLQKSLADWFNALGLPCTRLLHPLTGLPNSLWMVSRPLGVGVPASVLEKMESMPIKLKQT